MKSYKTFLAAGALMLAGMQTAIAQNENNNGKEEVRTYPYAFVGVQGGVQAVLNGYKFGDVITPVGAVNAGAWFSPALGARVQVNGWKSKEGVKGFGTYDFTYGAAGIDAMVNLTNAFTKTDDHVFNVILLGGVGVNKAWGHNYRSLTDAAGNNYYYNGNPVTSKTELGSRVHNHVAFQTRVGLMFDFNIGRNWSVNLEGDANHIGSRGYAHEFNAARNWQFVGLLGVTYKFGGKKAKAAPAPAPAPAPEPKPEPKPQPKPEPKPQPKPETKPQPKPEVKKESMRKEVFFVINKTTSAAAEAAKVEAAAQWLKSHPAATATVQGYADKGTGNATINERLAKQRAQNVARMLTEKYGIEASRLSVSSDGDTVQPFSRNDDNRVVVIVAEEK